MVTVTSHSTDEEELSRVIARSLPPLTPAAESQHQYTPRVI